jgi:hypothetical protein
VKAAARPPHSKLQEVLAAIFFEPFHYFADVLGALARADQQGIGGLDYY